MPGRLLPTKRNTGISFDEATSVFLDPFALTFTDPDHEPEERTPKAASDYQRAAGDAHGAETI